MKQNFSGIPKDGTVISGCFWVNGHSWLITDYEKTLEETLMESLKDQKEYIARLNARVKELEDWLKENPKHKSLKKKPKKDK